MSSPLVTGIGTPVRSVGISKTMSLRKKVIMDEAKKFGVPLSAKWRRGRTPSRKRISASTSYDDDDDDRGRSDRSIERMLDQFD